MVRRFFNLIRENDMIMRRPYVIKKNKNTRLGMVIKIRQISKLFMRDMDPDQTRIKTDPRSYKCQVCSEIFPNYLFITVLFQLICLTLLFVSFSVIHFRSSFFFQIQLILNNAVPDPWAKKFKRIQLDPDP